MSGIQVPFAPPAIGEDEIAEVVDTLRSGWLTTGPKVARFEQDLAAFLDAPSALALSSGTAAMHLALVTLGVGRGDVVVTTTMTFASTVHVIEHAGARPLLVDVDADTLTMSIDALERAVVRGRDDGGRVVAVLPVHLHGHPVDTVALHEVARAHDLHVVEDAAHALPAGDRGHVVGRPWPGQSERSRNLVAFSFYATKNITTGEGGMLTGDRDLVDAARPLSLHGMSHDATARYAANGSWYYEVAAAGFKYNMMDLQAAIGIHQLRRLPQFQTRRRAIAARYTAAFATLEEVETPACRAGVEHAWHIYALRLHLDRLRIDRVVFIEELRALGIGTSVHFIPVHLHPHYRRGYDLRPADFPVALREYERMLSLPLHPGMSDAQVDAVIEAVTSVASRHRR